MRFEDLVTMFTPGMSAPVVPGPHGIAFPTDRVRGFVAPNLRARSDVTLPASPRVVVVSAAGAVGKSTLARELAARLSAAHWDLSKSGTVGQGTLAGNVSSALGWAKTASVMAAIQAAQQPFVIDALDEGRLKVSEAGFHDFLKDVATLGASASGPAIVLLGRTQIAEFAWLVLDDAGVQTALLEIEPFTDGQINEYIERRMDIEEPASAERRASFEKPFRAARDRIFSGLVSAISGSDNGDRELPAVRSFIGYAPVLDAIAVLLSKETNYSELEARLSESSAAQHAREASPAALLERVVVEILERERKAKLLANLRPFLAPLVGAGWNDWDSVYTRAEQCARLLARVQGAAPIVVTSLPAAAQSKYEQQLDSFFSEHPLLRDGRHFSGVVFESYVLADALARRRAWSSAAEAFVATSAWRPNRLFADFYVHLSAEEQDAPEPMIAVGEIGALYDAFLAAETERVTVYASLDGEDPADATAGVTSDVPITFELSFATASGTGEPRVDARALQMRVNPTDVLRFSRFVRNLSVTVPCAVHIGGVTPDLEIGPSVAVRCSRLTIDCASLTVGGRSKPRDDDASVVLEADECDSQLRQKPVAHLPFTARWPGAVRFPWTDFGEEPSVRASDPAYPVYLRFRRIIMTLRSHSKGSLARVRHKIEHQRVLKGELGQRLLEQLVGDGILRLDGNFYHLDPAQATNHVGVSYQDLRLGVFGDKLKAYMQAFAARYPKLVAAA